jgi:predicted DNA-binding transcriptional regulator AlpA
MQRQQNGLYGESNQVTVLLYWLTNIFCFIQKMEKRLGVSKATVYHYAKQGKIRKIADPHRLHREARYYKEEVDRLAIERENYPTGMRPRSGKTVRVICSKCL